MVIISNSLPRLGLGLAALGRPGYINLNRSDIFDGKDANKSDTQRRSIDSMQEKANEVMKSLVSLAKENDTKPWFDCARSYGLSEKFVGEFLKNNQISSSDVVVSSKWGYSYVADWNIELEGGAPHEIKDHSIENFLKQIEETKEQIGDYLNLYQVHSATFESGILTDTRVHEALASTRKEISCQIGLSVSSPVQNKIIEEALKIKTSDGERLFDSVQCTYNLLEQRPADALLKAHEEGMDIIIKEGMANGRILKNEKVVEISDRLGCTPDALALAFILAQPFKPRVLSGAVTPEQLESNAKCLKLAEELTMDDLQSLHTLAMDSEQYWQDRAKLAWN